MENFPEIARDFLAAQACLSVSDEAALEAALRHAISDDAWRVKVGESARRQAVAKTGATPLAVETARQLYEHSLPRPFRSWLLAGLSSLWRAGSRLKRARDLKRIQTLSLPVISVGGIGVGGAGKTPCVLHFAALLQQAGRHPAFLTRGYRRISQETCTVLAAGGIATVEQTGDEAQLLLRSGLGPVAICADRATGGRALQSQFPADLFVLESGIIKLLKDTNGDGKPDKSIVFADNLVLPSGIMKWKKGVLVVDVPDVWYLEDTNGDGKADKKEKMLTGFARTNPQHIANTPVLGVDNWIYIAHQGIITPKVSMEFNDTGSSVRYPGKPGLASLPRDAAGRSIRFRPDMYELEMLSGESQYGHTFDPWGHHFCTSNANHLFTEIISASYLQRNPSLLVADATENIPDHGDAAEVFPITTNPQHQLLTDVGVITSSCGVTWYQGGLFPDSFNNITFIAEPVHNLIHADRIHPKGASFSASRVYANKEFLASKDAWFRPVQFYIGPDGALYVIDYYRQIIEHPEWMSDDVNKSGALYNGSNKGRIYRIIPEGTSRVDWVNTLKLGEATNQVLVQSLAHKNSWWRRNAQRLLSDRNDSVIPAFLKQFIDTTTSSAGMVQAMWLLHSKGTIDSSVFIKAFNHPVAGVRENAIKIAETYLKKWPSIASHLFQLKNDSDARVRYQLLCSIGSVTGPVAESTRVQLLLKDIEDKWVQLAMLTSTSGKELTTLTRTIDELSDMETPGRKLFFENCAAVIALSQNVPAIKSSIRYATTGISEKSGWWQSAIMEGLLKGFSVKGIPSAGFYQEKQQLQKLFAASTPLSIRKSAMELVKSFGAGSGKSMNALIINARKN